MVGKIEVFLGCKINTAAGDDGGKSPGRKINTAAGGRLRAAWCAPS